MFILRNRKYWLSLPSTPIPEFMKKTCFLLLTVLLTTAALRAPAQGTDPSKENFPSTEKTLSQIGQAETHPNARRIRLADSATLTAPVKRPGLIRRIIDYYSRSNVDRTFEKKIDWSIAPGPNYSSDVGFGIGFLLAGLYRLDRTDSVTAPSNISIYGNFTTEKFVLLRFSGDNIYNHNKQRLSYSGAFVYFPGAFYGVGYNAGKEGYAQDLTTTMGTVNVSYCTSLAGRFYVGVSGGLNYTGAAYRSSGMTEYLEGIRDGRYEKPGGQRGELYDLWLEGRYLPEKQDPFSNYIAATGDRPNALNAHVGIFAQYDTRDVTFNASKGVFIKAEAEAHSNIAAAKKTLKDYVTTYRDPGYDITAASLDDVVEEIILQKRIEMWMEGALEWLDRRRLNMPIDRRDDAAMTAAGVANNHIYKAMWEQNESGMRFQLPRSVVIANPEIGEANQNKTN